MRIMGIDFGDSRIGIAVSDPLGWTAQGLDTIEWKGPAEHAAEKSGSWLSSTVLKIVIGLPRNMNGTIGPSGEGHRIRRTLPGYRAGGHKVG